MDCSNCGLNLDGIKVTTWTSKKDGQVKNAKWCPDCKTPHWINDPKPPSKPKPTIAFDPQKRIKAPKIDVMTEVSAIAVQLAGLSERLDRVVDLMQKEQGESWGSEG